MARTYVAPLRFSVEFATGRGGCAAATAQARPAANTESQNRPELVESGVPRDLRPGVRRRPAHVKGKYALRPCPRRLAHESGETGAARARTVTSRRLKRVEQLC